jgi:hypothetical protein
MLLFPSSSSGLNKKDGQRHKPTALKSARRRAHGARRGVLPPRIVLLARPPIVHPAKVKLAVASPCEHHPTPPQEGRSLGKIDFGGARAEPLSLCCVTSGFRRHHYVGRGGVVGVWSKGKESMKKQTRWNVGCVFDQRACQGKSARPSLLLCPRPLSVAIGC